MSRIRWNKIVRLIISDVDETIAGLYIKADSEMISELQKLLEEGIRLFLISGQSVSNITQRVAGYIDSKLRNRILIGHCSGAEVWGFDKGGDLFEKPFYSLYDKILNARQKNTWREIIQKLIQEFKLNVFPIMEIPEFIKISGGNPQSIMLEDGALRSLLSL